MSPIRTPGKRQSLRRSVLLSSTKKPVFTVTEIAIQNDHDHKEGPSSSPSTLRRKSKVVEQDDDVAVSGMLLVYSSNVYFYSDSMSVSCLFSLIDNELPVHIVTPRQKKTRYFLHYFSNKKQQILRHYLNF